MSRVCESGRAQQALLEHVKISVPSAAHEQGGDSGNGGARASHQEQFDAASLQLIASQRKQAQA